MAIFSLINSRSIFSLFPAVIVSNFSDSGSSPFSFAICAFVLRLGLYGKYISSSSVAE